MAKPFPYRQAALIDATPEDQPAVIAMAEFLHRNESMHMHEDVGSKDPCGYCWLRARYAYVAMQKAGFALVHREQRGAEIEQLRQRIRELESDRAGRPNWSDGRDLAIKFRNEGATDGEITEGFLGLWGGAK